MKQVKYSLMISSFSFAITFALFFIMANLINQENKQANSNMDTVIDFLRSTHVSHTETRKRTLPKKAIEPKLQPQMPKLAVKQSNPTQDQSLAMKTPMLSSNLSFGSGPYLGGGVGQLAGNSANTNSDVIPLVRIEPQYPRKAAMAGKEGWVKLKFDITESGAVANVDVLASKPRRVFDQAAKRAIQQWKYRPKMKDGKAAIQRGLMVQLDFKLRN